MNAADLRDLIDEALLAETENRGMDYIATEHPADPAAMYVTLGDDTFRIQVTA